MTELLLLIRSALENRPLCGPDFDTLLRWSVSDWEQILGEAKAQSVLGLVYQAVSIFPSETPVPEQIVFKLVAEGDAIQARSRTMEAKANALIREWTRVGLHPRLLKGPETARYYPCPLLRGYGDIDLFLPQEETAAAIATVQAAGYPVHTASDGSFHFEWNGTDVDVHSRYYDLSCSSALLPDPSSAEGTLLLLSAHALKHAMGAGVGLRQLCDVAAAFRSLDGQYAPNAYLDYCRNAGILRWSRLLSRFLSCYLGVPDRLFPDNRVSPVPLMRQVREGGNFGHHGTGRLQALNGSLFHRKADTAFRFLRHLPFSLWYAPREFFPWVWGLIKGNR